MADQLERPVFAEGEILRAQDLNNAIEQARLRAARHARQQHRWGIVRGLELKWSKDAKELTLSPGVAIDVRGRELVVPNTERISPDVFTVSGTEEDWFPLFLLAVDEQFAGDAILGGCGGASGPRVRESFELQFQRPGEAEHWDTYEEQPSVTDGPDYVSGQSRRPRVLVGFVKWDSLEKQFTEATGDLDYKRARRLAGPLGHAWETPDAKVQVRLGASPYSDKDVLALLVGEDAKSQKVLARFDNKGNLRITGDLILERTGQAQTPTDSTPTPTPTSTEDVKLISGTASDGVQLPLPPGVDEAHVTEEKVALHVFTRPVASSTPVLVTECGVDAERRVRCLARVLSGTEDSTGQLTGLKLGPPQSWSVEYLVLTRTLPAKPA